MSNTFDRSFESGGAGYSSWNGPPEPETLAECIFDNIVSVGASGLAGLCIGLVAGYMFDNTKAGGYIGASTGVALRSAWAYFDIKHFLSTERDPVVREYKSPFAEPEKDDNDLGDEMVERFREHVDNVGSDYKE